jgi:hypothetical protein
MATARQAAKPSKSTDKTEQPTAQVANRSEGHAQPGIDRRNQMRSGPTRRSKEGEVASRGPTGKRSPGRRSAAAKPVERTFRPETKGALIVTFLKRKEGASIAELSTAAGWQAHSVRGFLSGLAKRRGIAITSKKGNDGQRRYRIAS